MRVLLISANTENINMVPLPLGLNCVAVAAREAGHQVELLDLMSNVDHKAAVTEAIGRVNPQIIGISVRNVDNQNMGKTRFLLGPVRSIISLCRIHSNAPIVIGGAGFSIFPVAALRYLGADMGVCGEGEVAFPMLLDTLERGGDWSTISGLCLPGKPVLQGCAERAALDRLPLPDPKLWHVPEGAGKDIWVPFQTRRGCGMKCSYCSTPALEGTTTRKHPVKEVVEAIAHHVRCGFDRFYFVDNTFNLPIEYAKTLCGGLIRAGLKVRWRCILYPGFLDRELVRLLAKSGCVEVSLGFESGSEEVLRRLNKLFTPQQVRKSSELLAEYGIKRTGFLLLGGPGETRDSVMESLAFADSLKLDMLKLTMGIRIYPGTVLHRVAREEGLVSDEDDLLFPRFYMAKGLGEWLARTIKEWMAGRPYCCT
jgi:radical SAM superfamily enzyme YgiQ (UPF0313 family)